MSTTKSWFLCAGICVNIISAICSMAADTVRLQAIPQGIAARMSSLRPHQLDLLEGKPDIVTKVPAGIDSPLFGSLTLGPQESPTQFTVVMDVAATTGEPHVWIDTNANGDLTDDPPIKWEHEDYKSFDSKPLRLYRAGVDFQVRYGDHITPLRLSIVRYDPNDPNRSDYRNSLLFVADYARAGDVTLGKSTYHVMFYDLMMTGDFRGQKDQPLSGVAFMIDANQNGQFDARGESFDAWHPFTIKGITYELANMTPDGTSFEVIKSTKKVPEIPPPPDLRVGKIVPSFKQTLIDGKAVNFPADFKGQPVLLYFWAAYCGDCQKEMPNVKKVYDQWRPKGLAMLGVSVDPDKGEIPLLDYYRKNRFTWPQIYEAKFWLGSIVQLYFIQNVPAAFLIDGTTGKILASGNELMGTNLEPTIKRFLSPASPKSTPAKPVPAHTAQSHTAH